MTWPDPPAPVFPAQPPWKCVVEPDQVWRDNTRGVFFDVVRVSPPSPNTANASVTLRPHGARSASDLTLSASLLCGGSEWSRLPEEEDPDTVLFDKTRVGVGPARPGSPS